MTPTPAQLAYLRTARSLMRHLVGCGEDCRFRLRQGSRQWEYRLTVNPKESTK